MIPRDTVAPTLKQLNELLEHHELWSRDLARTVACGLPADPRNLGQDAAEQCHFGHWYRGPDSAQFQDHEGFTELGADHQSMHDGAVRMLQATERGQKVAPADFDAFASALIRFRTRLRGLIRELDAEIRNNDSLTGAESRAPMLPDLHEMLAVVKRGSMACCLAVIDLDHFKAINDQFGHQVGDEVLIGVVASLRESLRPYDKVYRYGGDEFLIALPYTDLDVARAILERTRAHLMARVRITGHNTPAMSASFGFTSLDPTIAVEESIARADTALYRAKRSGRNCLIAWEDPPSDHSSAQ